MKDVSQDYLKARALDVAKAKLGRASDAVLLPNGDVWNGFETSREKWLNGAVVIGLAFAAFKMGQESVRKQSSSLPSLGTLVGTYVAFKALDAIWPLGKGVKNE